MLADNVKTNEKIKLYVKRTTTLTQYVLFWCGCFNHDKAVFLWGFEVNLITVGKLTPLSDGKINFSFSIIMELFRLYFEHYSQMFTLPPHTLK